ARINAYRCPLRKGGKGRRGLTLVELLVTMAVVAVLVAVLLPVLSKAREAARKAVCQSNLKQIGVAFSLYLSDWDGFYPCNGDPNLWMGRNWRVVIQPYVGGSELESRPFGYERPIKVRHSDIFLCPSDTTAPRRWERTSYGYSACFYHRPEDVNSLEGRLSGSTCANWAEIIATIASLPCVPQHESSVKFPAEKALCGEWLSNHEKLSGDCGWWDWRGAGNYLFADGHVKYLKRSRIKPAVSGLPDINLTKDGIRGRDI
ncbi:MAG TPA: DUF1559 domain-containing protein, partial [Armatimonadetes bacterium]|nr:DUF1559 domain-containing protein [Armatimonadota bacterium]